MDVLSDYIERVSKKVQAAELKNVHVVKRDAMDTGLDAESNGALQGFLIAKAQFSMMALKNAFSCA